MVWWTKLFWEDSGIEHRIYKWFSWKIQTGEWMACDMPRIVLSKRYHHTSYNSSFPKFPSVFFIPIFLSLRLPSISFQLHTHSELKHHQPWNTFSWLYREKFVLNLMQWPLYVLPLVNHIPCVKRESFLWDLSAKSIVKISSVLFKGVPLGCAHAIQDLASLSKCQR